MSYLEGRYGVLNTVYPRGFVGPQDYVTTWDKTNDDNDIKIEVVQNTYAVKEGEKKENEGHSEMMRMYVAFKQDYNIMFNTNFRTNLLTLAKDMFFNPGDFIEAQAKSPSFNNIHIEFLEDVLRFIEKDTSRMRLEDWGLLVKPVVKREGFELVKYDVNRFKRLVESFKFHKVEDLLAMWLSREGGFKHLVLTMAIILGPETLRK